MNSKQKYRRIEKQLDWINIGANFVGALLTMFYFVNVQFDYQQSMKGGLWLNLVLMVLITVGLLALGGHFSEKRLGPMRAWYLQKGPDDVPPQEIQQLALNLPITMLVTALSMWLLAGVSFGLLSMFSSFPSELDWSAFIWSFLGIGVIAGPITAVIVYFANESVWSAVLPDFFPEGSLIETPAFRMTVRRRMLILFVMVLMPLLLLAALSYNQAIEMAHAPEPLTMLPRLLRLEIFLVGVGLVESVVLSSTLGASLVKPLEALGKRMDAVQQGDLQTEMAVTSNDEIGHLIAGFNTMVAGLRQEEVIRRLFSLYVTPEVAQHAIKHGAELGGQMTEATVLFSDIRGFTSLSERMRPASLLALLNRYFDRMSDVIVDHGGFVNKFGGDSLLAVFGTPLNPIEDHPCQAIQAAGEMLVTLERFNREQEGLGEPRIRIGIGIATGPVVAGNVGSTERLEYTVIGDTVNLASRLEEMTKDLAPSILVSASTADLIAGRLPLTPIDQIDIRGKQAPVLVYAPSM